MKLSQCPYFGINGFVELNYKTCSPGSLKATSNEGNIFAGPESKNSVKSMTRIRLFWMIQLQRFRVNVAFLLPKNSLLLPQLVLAE